MPDPSPKPPVHPDNMPIDTPSGPHPDAMPVGMPSGVHPDAMGMHSVPDRARAAIQPGSAAPGRPRYLSHEEMKAVIAAGGSVLHNGRSLVRVEQLPSQAELDGTGPSAADLEAQIASLHARLAAMKAAEPEKEPEPAKAAEPEKPAPKK